MGKKINWKAIEREFIEGILQENGVIHRPLLEELAAAHGVKYQTVRIHSAKDNWVEKRATYEQEMESRILEERKKKRLKAIIKFEDRCLDISNRGIAHILGHFKVIQDKGKAEGKDISLMPLKDLVASSRALERYQKAGCIALNIPDRNTTVSGPMGSPIEIIQQSPEELDRRIREQYKLLGYDPEPKATGIEAQKTTLGEALRRLNTQESEEILSDKEKLA